MQYLEPKFLSLALLEECPRSGLNQCGGMSHFVNSLNCERNEPVASRFWIHRFSWERTTTCKIKTISPYGFSRPFLNSTLRFWPCSWSSKSLFCLNLTPTQMQILPVNFLRKFDTGLHNYEDEIEHSSVALFFFSSSFFEMSLNKLCS